MIEDDLKAAFARHENQAPDVGMLRAAIDTTTRQRRRRRNSLRVTSLAVLAALAMLVPWLITNMGGLSSLPIAVPSVLAGPDGEVNVLLLGSDMRAGVGWDKSRADTIVWMHIPASRERVYLISLSRDLLVEIPGHGQDKINSSYFHGGAKLAASTVEKLVGKKLDGTVELDFSAADQVVDAVGGMEICLPQAVVSLHYYKVGSEYTYVNEHEAHQRRLKPYVHQQGCHQYSGRLAVDLMRQRKGLSNGAYGRDQNGQLALIALARRVSALNLLTDADKIAALLKVDGLKTDTNFSIAGLAWQMRGIQPSNVVGISAPTFSPRSDHGEKLDKKMLEALAALRGGTLDNWVADPRNVEWINQWK